MVRDRRELGIPWRALIMEFDVDQEGISTGETPGGLAVDADSWTPLPRGVHRRLKSQAALNKRSLNGEIVEILEKAMQSQPVNIDDFIADLDRFHARHKIPPITEEMLRAAKNEGRP